MTNIDLVLTGIQMLGKMQFLFWGYIWGYLAFWVAKNKLKYQYVKM